jgi:hypothetical protein
MPSKRTFAKRLGALVATGLGVSEPLGALIVITANSFRVGVEERWFSRP